MISAESDFRFSFDPVTPYSASHLASVGNSTSLSIYTASWSAHGVFDFLIEANHVAAGGNGVVSLSVGSIYLTPAVDSILTIDAEYDYALGNGDREGFFRVNAAKDGVGAIFFDQESVIPIGGDPRIGTYVSNAVIPLEAGIMHGIGYFLELRSFGGSPTNLSTGNGSVHFSIVPVPEPHSALLLSIAPMLAYRRRHT